MLTPSLEPPDVVTIDCDTVSSHSGLQSSSSSSSDNEVQNCSKQCLESFKTLQKNFDSEREKHSRARLEIQGYELALESLESRILGHEKNELDWGEKYEFQNYELKSSDEEITPANDRFSEADGYHVVPPPIIGNFLTPRADISFAGLDEYAIRKKIIESKTTELNTDTNKSKTSETVGKTNEVNIEKPKSVHESVVPKPKINRDKVLIEDWYSNDEDDVSEVNTVSLVKTNETQIVKTQVDKIGQISQKEGIGFKKIKTCFVCKIKDYDFYAKKSPEPKLKTTVNTGQRVVKPVWDNAKRVNHQKNSNKLKYPQGRRNFVPSGVLTRTSLVNPVRPNGKRVVHTVNTARPISIARPVSTTRSYYTKPAFRPKNLKQDVKTSGVKNMTTAGIRAVVSTGKGKMDNALKKSRWGNPEIYLQDHAVVDSGYSSHMTSNKAYLSDYEDYNGGFVAFGSDPKGGKITGKDATGIINLLDAEIYEGLATLGGYVREHVPLLPAMLASVAEDQGEGSAIPAAPHHTPIDPIPSTSQPSIPSTTEPPHSSPPRSINRQNTEVPQPQGPIITFVADEATTTSMGVETEGAATKTSGLDAGMDSDIKNWLVQKQTTFGKDFSNPFTTDSLLKTISAPCYSNEALAIPEQTATGKEISNPFMAGEDCWVLEDFTTYCCWFNIGAASEDLVLLRKIEENRLSLVLLV
ncbi:hypothetical protein Tco_0781859 [Tanacetum coccineum]